MQKMCNAKHQLLHMGGMVCLCSACCPRSSGVQKIKNKKYRVALTAGDLLLNTWLHFHSLKNYVEEGRKSCWGFEFLVMSSDDDYEIQ